MSGSVGDNTARASGVIKAAGGGKILQIVNATDSTERAIVSTSFATGSNTLTATITPSATSSKILVEVTTAMSQRTANEYSCATLQRTIGGSGLTNLGSAYGLAMVGGTSGTDIGSAAITYLDSPSTTSECVYQVYGRSTSGPSTDCRLNRDGVKGSIVAMEVDGS